MMKCSYLSHYSYSYHDDAFRDDDLDVYFDLSNVICPVTCLLSVNCCYDDDDDDVSVIYCEIFVYALKTMKMICGDDGGGGAHVIYCDFLSVYVQI